MKMEVLSVQNHIQGQFGVIGTTKVKDWTSPLTAPAPLTASATGVAATAPPTAAVAAAAAAEVNVADVDIGDVDVVDGHPASVLHMRQHQHYALNPTRPRLSSSASTSSTTSSGAAVSTAKPPASPLAFDGVSSAAAYMSNVLQAAPPAPPPTLPASPMQSTAASRFGAIDNLDDVNPGAVQELSQRLQTKLRDAKSRHLACTEVTLPNDLTQRIAAEIIRMSEREPCGERACTIFIEFESEPDNARRIASFKVDPDTVSIFELYLTLKQDKSGWTSLLPQFLKNLTRSNTIMISPDFTLTKNKLYSSE
ncbi:protein charybde [Drosophila sulfurigaster albostrigata]|uniref:Protein charybde n=1 Tax=Drosophila albomicans TaxID=7291 RepID=A0A6P8WZM5_DROAB|nr:protein charybde [Drosophila albomicans]XP_062136874.1 protein charybde [Drosophila sulfurigaster albostrigata]